jgi:hypothetical protein
MRMEMKTSCGTISSGYPRKKDTEGFVGNETDAINSVLISIAGSLFSDERIYEIARLYLKCSASSVYIKSALVLE